MGFVDLCVLRFTVAVGQHLSVYICCVSVWFYPSYPAQIQNPERQRSLADHVTRTGGQGHPWVPYVFGPRTVPHGSHQGESPPLPPQPFNLLSLYVNYKVLELVLNQHRLKPIACIRFIRISTCKMLLYWNKLGFKNYTTFHDYLTFTMQIRINFYKLLLTTHYVKKIFILYRLRKLSQNNLIMFYANGLWVLLCLRVLLVFHFQAFV